MEKTILKAQLEILVWVIRLTYTGMPLSMFRHYILKKHEELEKILSA